MTVNPTRALAMPVSVTIDSGTSITAAINLGGRIPVGIIMPAAWTAANITFQASADGSSFADIYDASGEYALTNAAADRYLDLDSNVFFGPLHLKVRSGTTGTPVNQGAERVLTLLLGVPDR